MVIVARALAQQPSFLIMDEPTASLDFGNQIKIINRVNELKNDALGILMATHSPDQAFMCNAEVAVVHNGGIRHQGHCEQVITDELLNEIYGVEINVCDVMNKKSEYAGRICVPAL
jgi:iron complex transport system ATP-binding protein